MQGMWACRCLLNINSMTDHDIFYTHRTSFATYLIAILLFIFTIQQGAKFTVITGCLMILAVFAYGIIIINDPPFEVPFQDAMLKP